MIPLLTFQARGACRDHDPELFFPVSETAVNTRQIDRAKAVCQGCPVLADCREYALVHGPEGIWGGMTEDERRAVRAAENRVAVTASNQDEADQGDGEGAGQPESSPSLPSYTSARASLTRARRALDLAEQSEDGNAIARAEQRLDTAKQQFDAVRTQPTSGAVA